MRTKSNDKFGRRPKFNQTMQGSIFIRLPEAELKALREQAAKQGYDTRSSGGVSGFVRDLLLSTLKDQRKEVRL